MAYIVVAHIVTAYVVMAYIVMAYIAMAYRLRRATATSFGPCLYSYGLSSYGP